jgi:hypothetical protein
MAEKLDTADSYVEDLNRDEASWVETMNSLMEWWDDLEINSVNMRTTWLMRLSAKALVVLGETKWEKFMDEFDERLENSPRRFKMY